jgi:methyl coenzyme M reductase gamma subunit
MEKDQSSALDDPIKTGEELSKEQLKKRALAAKDQEVKSKEKAEDLKDEADSLKPEV